MFRWVKNNAARKTAILLFVVSAYLLSVCTSTAYYLGAGAKGRAPGAILRQEEAAEGIVVSLCVENAAGLSSADYILTYDPAILRCGDRMEAGDFTGFYQMFDAASPLLMQNIPTAGRIRVSIAMCERIYTVAEMYTLCEEQSAPAPEALIAAADPACLCLMTCTFSVLDPAAETAVIHLSANEDEMRSEATFTLRLRPVSQNDPTEPETTSCAPDPTTQEPEHTTQKPEPTTRQPETTTRAAEPTTRQPETTTHTPEPTTRQPETATQITEPTTRQPETTTRAAEPTTRQPETTTRAAEPTTRQPETTTRTAEPTTRQPETTTRTAEPTTRQSVTTTDAPEIPAPITEPETGSPDRFLPLPNSLLKYADGIIYATPNVSVGDALRYCASGARICFSSGAAVPATFRLCSGMVYFAGGRKIPIVLLGDADGDGFITAADARIALRLAVNLEEASVWKNAACDLSGFGVITAMDARLILRGAVGLETPAEWFAAVRPGAGA